MRTLDETDFPIGVAERIINTLSVTEENLQDLKDTLYFINELTSSELKDVIDELFQQMGI